jgi:hypothetical protein
MLLGNGNEIAAGDQKKALGKGGSVVFGGLGPNVVVIVWVDSAPWTLYKSAVAFGHQTASNEPKDTQ